MTRWKPSEVGNWEGRRVVITGANSGIGLEAARVLLAHGATVVMACRDTARGEAAALAAAPASGTAGRAVVRRLDLAHLSSVREFAAQCLADEGPLFALVNNAGVMACPLTFTEDGLEMQMGTNHFGHALLTSLLVPRIDPGGRIVVVSSIAARGGKLTAAMTAGDLTAPVPYAPQAVYSNTKQANLLFAQELQRRLASSGSKVAVVGVHPGVAATELFLRQMRDSGRGWIVPVARPVMKVILQSAAAGAWPTLRALSDPSLEGGELIGPRSLGQSRGAPQLLRVFPQGADAAAASRLWELTEEVLSIELLTS
ncbi:MAG: SDR family NAD(P)-dependent oxidoreductase [Acidimicrobiales bacterium]